MRKNVIICLNPFESHFFPTISLARQLENSNYSVSYMGPEKMKEYVIKEGFRYISLTSYSEKLFNELLSKKSYKQLEILYKKLHEEILSNFIADGTDIVLIGISRYHLYLIPAINCKAKIIFYSLCGGVPWINTYSPPITADYICLSRFKRIVNLLLWLKRLFRKGINPKVIYQRSFYPWTKIYRLCHKKNIKWKFGIDGFFPSFPILIFGTKHLEFFDFNKVTFLGLCVNESNINKVAAIPDKLTHPLIYCSLGTMNNRYKKAETFYKAIIDLFKTMPQWNLVLSIGNTIQIDQSNLPKNIFIYKYAPQLSILKHADMAITHGGYGTVKECIKYNVPMLVLPCSYDQRGNAARVHYHKIGIRDFLLETTHFEKKFGLNMENITPQYLKLLISKVLFDPRFKKNITKFHQKVENAKEFQVGYNSLFQ